MPNNAFLSQVRLASLRLICDKNIPLRYGHHLRGWLMQQFPNQPLVSHHEDSGTSIYIYPRVQSKVFLGNALILGIDEGVDFITELVENKPSILLLNREKFIVDNIITETATAAFGISNDLYQYDFITPWLGLNQENYKKYLVLRPGKDRQALLSSILVGNVLSAAKSLGIFLGDQIEIRPFLKPIQIRFKGRAMIGFKGNFRANLKLPNLIGLGKSVSRGFGTIIKD